jgi:hypothetical protein
MVQGETGMSDWTWEDIEAYEDFMDSWANAYLCDEDDDDVR